MFLTIGFRSSRLECAVIPREMISLDCITYDTISTFLGILCLQLGLYQISFPSIKSPCINYFIANLFVCLFEVMLNVQVNSYGHIGTLPPFHGLFTKMVLGWKNRPNIAICNSRNRPRKFTLSLFCSLSIESSMTVARCWLFSDISNLSFCRRWQRMFIRK